MRGGKNRTKLKTSVKSVMLCETVEDRIGGINLIPKIFHRVRPMEAEGESLSLPSPAFRWGFSHS